MNRSVLRLAQVAGHLGRQGGKEPLSSLRMALAVARASHTIGKWRPANVSTLPSWSPGLRALPAMQRRMKHGKKGKQHAQQSKEVGTGVAGSETLDGVANVDETKARLERVLEGMKHEFRSLRGGRADPAMFDHVQVDAYGTPTALADVAQASMKGPQLMVLNVYDPGLVAAVTAAVRDCGMDLNPSGEAGRVTVPIPKMSKETRDAMGKLAGKQTEKSKAVMRGIRHKVLDRLKKSKDSFPEDEVHKRKKQIDTVTQEAETEAARLLDKKKGELTAA